jgi:eukaryotic-like serine/threonine-protein kinase
VGSIGSSSPRRWRSRLQAVLWCLSTVAAVMFGGALTFATVDDAWRSRVLLPTPPEVKLDLIVRDATDVAGHQASFRIMLLTDEFRWRLGSSSALESGARPEFTPEMTSVLNNAEEVVCVGASSEEIDPGTTYEAGRAREEKRAARRAERIALWVQSALTRPIPTRKLNAGHHIATSAAVDTADQRRMVIILVLEHDKETNIDEALRSAMIHEAVRAPIFETLLSQYSLAMRPQFTWVQ